ncbi:MMPL family transporter [Natronolimnobius sp. AArcel1]|uniref:efflux RND transporter permease subunit n=1 Tax=Natronolimnobius sp. AArcel1 TaxID=1679093 RepID=UPI0013EA1450|nr:MMPL family transporter [Natronolimnobius sp. AArcel1]NGM67662.1 MMPL family transporter [Natronolimnobius sp. AArcel1]
MSLPHRLAAIVTDHSRIVFVALLLLTALVGAGMPMVDDDSSLDQFETDSPEAQAMDDIDERFGTDDNTTAVQLITRGDGDNVLERESLLESLEFQQEIRSNESINETLADDDPITGVENLVAITANATEQGEELEERGEELGEREAELEARSAQLEAGINESRDLQREYEQLSAEYDEDDPEYQQGAADIEAGYDELLEEITTEANLDDEQAETYEEFAGQARMLESDLYELEQSVEDPDQLEELDEYQEIQEGLDDVYAGATMGVLEDEYEQLEDDFDAFEADQEALEEDDERLSLEEQIETLETIDDDAFEDALEDTLADGDNGEDGAGLAFMPSEYEPGSTDADARMTSIMQDTGGDDLEMGAAEGGNGVVDAQQDLGTLASAHEHDHVVFGVGIITDEIDRSMVDSLSIVGPLALAFVAAALLVAYRDPLDIVLGLIGIVAVLVWTFGFMGWAGISFNQMFVAVPVLLIGLSIDYAIHVFMRHREQREAARATVEAERVATESGINTVRGSMSIALAGVGVALVWVTATTAIGFLANLISPIGPIQEFGVVSSVGIISALIVFGGLIPAAKVEIDSWLESRGFDRHKRAFGTGGSRFSSLLSVGSVVARRIPLVLLVAVLLLTAGGVYGASQVDTSFEEEDFLAESPPEWTQNLPGSMAPGEYQAADNLDYINENFQRDDVQAQILVEGDVANGDVLERLEAAQDEASDSPVTYTLPTGDADVESPLSVMEETAAQNESFNESFQAADTTGDDVPDEDVPALFDELFEVDEDAASNVIHRTDDGEYDSVRLIVATEGDAAFADTTDEMRIIAGSIDDDGIGDDRAVASDDEADNESVAAADYSGVSAIATGDPLVNYIVEQDLLDTVLQSLLITLVAVFTFLSAAYWLTGNSATLGAVTLLPVAFATSWILGTMYLIGMPFNVLTGMITSLTIGLGVAYSIHISARYTLELDRQGNVWDAMNTTVTGTGGALLGSAATTVGGFGTLAFAILPVLRQFGIITGLTIIYAFLASVVVLPTLLVLWTRYLGPDVSFDRHSTQRRTPAASDGGSVADDEAAETEVATQVSDENDGDTQ